MSDTTFVNNSTVIDASWLNDVNDTVYGALNAAQTPTAARTALGLGTAATFDVGITANKVVQLDGTAKLPAVDGSQLTGIVASVVDVTGATGILPVAHGGTGATTAATARANLGSTTVGDAVFIAADAAAARVTLGTDSADQLQSATRFTAGGTADAITGSLAPAIASYVAGLRVTVTPSGANTVTGPTLNMNSLGTKTIKKRDSGGTKVALVAGDYNASGPFNLEYDGTDFILLDPLPAAAVSSSSVPVRQTVLSGPVDSSGFAAFGGSTGSTTVTASGTLKATACAGGDANYTGSIVNPSWTGLSTNGTMFLYLDITSGGVVTTGSTTLEPTYQWGGTYSTTNLQNTFNIQEMTMKAGNGSTASQVYRVFVGEVTVAGGVVTAIVWYQLMGRYDSGWTATLPNTATQVSKNSNLGITPDVVKVIIECTTTDGGYAVGDRIASDHLNGQPSTNSASVLPIVAARNTVGFVTGSSGTAWYSQNKTTGAAINLTRANWKYKLITNRGW